MLAEIGYTGWPKTSGNRGIHIAVRIEPRWEFPVVRRCALAFAREIERRAPDLVTTAWWKEERGERVFIDYNQNARDRTIASAYSVRPRPDATVSAPVTWDELPDVETEDFTLVTMQERFARLGDVQAGIDDTVCDLEVLLEWVEREEAEGVGEAPYPPNFPKMPGEPPRVQPSRAKKPRRRAERPRRDVLPPRRRRSTMTTMSARVGCRGDRRGARRPRRGRDERRRRRSGASGFGRSPAAPRSSSTSRARALPLVGPWGLGGGGLVVAMPSAARARRPRRARPAPMSSSRARTSRRRASTSPT